MEGQIESSPNTLVQCRICHDEDEDSNMEAPCSCCGTLKYAHRRCVQRWCNEKGNTTCEICQQQFNGYTAPPPAPLFHYGGSPINFGDNLDWEISRRDLRNHLFAANHEFRVPDLEYSAPSTSSLMCFRIVAIVFIVLLVLRHTLQVIFILGGAGGEYSSTVFMLIMLGIIGINIPVYIIVKGIIDIQRLQYQGQYYPMQSRGENNMGQPHLRAIHIQ